MADNHTLESRHVNMSHIHSKDTKPEEIVRKYLFSKGLRYRKNVSKMPGKPDIVFRKYKTVVFVNGCFWHHLQPTSIRRCADWKHAMNLPAAAAHLP